MSRSLGFPVSACLTVVACLLSPARGEASDVPESARRIAALVQLAVQEYRLAFDGTSLVNRAERDEAALFVAEARRTAVGLPGDAARALEARLASVASLIERAAPPDSVSVRATAVTRWLADTLGISLEERPARVPTVAGGKRVYVARCAQCHGVGGLGDGSAAAGLDPPPARLGDPAVLAAVTPLDAYRKVSLGVPGTGMPGFAAVLTREERWDVVAYVVALGDSMARRIPDASRVLALATARASLVRARDLAAGGDAVGAAAQVLDGYLAFEEVEKALRAMEPGLVLEAERAFALFREAASARAPAADLGRRHAEVGRLLSRTAGVLAERPSAAGLFAGSFMLLVREGFEAILILAAIVAVVEKAGATSRRREVWWGAGLAVAASLVTAALLHRLLRLAPARQEVLEGAVMLVAAVVLFSVSFWLVSKLDLAAWRRFVRGRIQGAMSGGGAAALAAAAFLAVYREGFETVLFYQALYGTAGPAGTAPVTAGLLGGAAALVLLYVAIERFGVRIPLRPFFGFTGALLYMMAFAFAGRGVVELQEGRVLPATPLPDWPHSQFLGLFPTLESVAAQGALVLALLVGLAWLLWRRFRSAGPHFPPLATHPSRLPRSSDG